MSKKKTIRYSIQETIPAAYLMAEVNPGDKRRFKAMLADVLGKDTTIICVDGFIDITDALSRGKFEALVLDVNLIEHNALNDLMNLAEKYPELPIVVLADNANEDIAIESLRRGAQDYLNKLLLTPEILSRSLRYAKERKRIEFKLRKALYQADRKNTQLVHLAQRDFLTNLPNRARFELSAVRMISLAARLKKKVALLYINLNGFKAVNDSFGHAAGDQLLKMVADRLRQRLQKTDIIARLGADEFVIMSDLVDSQDEITLTVSKVMEAFNAPFLLESCEVGCVPAIGVAVYPQALTLTQLMRQADRAMYEAKLSRFVPVCYFTHALDEAFSRHIEIESACVDAIRHDEFDVVFQAIHCAKDNTFFQAEALLRWTSEELGVIQPPEFIPIVETSPVINQLTKIVLQRSVQLLDRIDLPVRKMIKINVTASQLVSKSFCHMFIDWMRELNVSPGTLCLELTERELVRNSQLCREQIDLLRREGVALALDDFGSGYSSIKHLLDMPIDYLKLDRILIDNIDTNMRIQALTAGVIEMAHRLGIQVVAEGIERAEELETVKQLGCDYFQGYYLGMPESADNLVAHWLHQQRQVALAR